MAIVRFILQIFRTRFQGSTVNDIRAIPALKLARPPFLIFKGRAIKKHSVRVYHWHSDLWGYWETHSLNTVSFDEVMTFWNCSIRLRTINKDKLATWNAACSAMEYSPSEAYNKKSSGRRSPGFY